MATLKQHREKTRKRTASSRQAVIDAGGSYIGTVIGPEATEALRSLTLNTTTKRDAIEAALIQASRESER